MMVIQIIILTHLIKVFKIVFVCFCCNLKQSDVSDGYHGEIRGAEISACVGRLPHVYGFRLSVVIRVQTASMMPPPPPLLPPPLSGPSSHRPSDFIPHLARSSAPPSRPYAAMHSWSIYGHFDVGDEREGGREGEGGGRESPISAVTFTALSLEEEEEAAAVTL